MNLPTPPPPARALPQPNHDPRVRFDRGTLVFEGLGEDRGGPAPPGAVWDGRVGAYRAPARRHAEVRPSLASGAPPTDDVIAPGPPPPREAWSPIGLRPYQDAALLAWDLAGRRGVVVLPTGAGKTRLALAAIARSGVRALVLVPTRALLEQWRGAFAKVYSGPLGCYGDGVRERAPITVATFESAYRHMDTLGDRFEMLVVDEAHHAGSDLREEALEMCAAPARLGLTATPPAKGPAALALEALVGPTVFALAIGDLQGSFLADYELIVLELSLSPEERAAYDADMKRFSERFARFRALAPEAGWQDFSRTAARTPEGREALEGYRRARRLLGLPRAKAAAVDALARKHREARLLIFTADNEAAYEIARRRLIMPLTCDIPRREREEALARFRSGELRALVSARVLNEGIDVPDADVAIVVGGALGEREHVQRVGRLLRPGEGKKALVYELVARGTVEVRQSRRRRAGLAARTPAAL